MGILQILATITQLLLTGVKYLIHRSTIHSWILRPLHCLLDCFPFRPSQWLTDTELGDLDLDLECNDFSSEYSVSVKSLVQI